MCLWNEQNGGSLVFCNWSLPLCEINVHFPDMKMLEKTYLDVYHDFTKYGLFVIPQTKNSFSAIRINCWHEQNDEDLKGNGGTFGITVDV